MQLNNEVVTTPPRASATVVLLRDTPQLGLEVFLLRRHTASAVLGGAYVFPGGKLDEADCDPALHAHLDRSPQALHQALGEPDLDVHTAAGLYAAAVRESLEECGVLYARARHQDSLAPNNASNGKNNCTLVTRLWMCCKALICAWTRSTWPLGRVGSHRCSPR